MVWKGVVIVGILLTLIFTGMLPVVAEESSNLTPAGVILPAPSLQGMNQTAEISDINIIALLNLSDSAVGYTPASVALILVKPGMIMSPKAVRPNNEVLYILEGSAEVVADDVSLNATIGDTVLVPAGSMMAIRNSGPGLLRFVSILSSEISGQDVIAPGFMKRSIGNVTPVRFGNESSPDQFEVTRILSTFEEFLPLSFDLVVAHLSAGHTTGDHFLESGQVGYVLSGNGNITINCVTSQIKTGDVTFVSPNAVQNFTADEDLTILLLTEPFYIPEQDHMAEPVC